VSRVAGRWLASVVLVAALAVAGSGSGCGSCDVDCGEPIDVLDRRVTVESIDGTTVHAVLSGGQTLDVRIFGDVREIQAGREYLMPLMPGSGGTMTASLPRDCDCGGPYVRNADGTAIQSHSISVPWRPLGFAILAATVAVVAIWGSWRWWRGERL